jgi:hypothetical protein
MFDTSNIKDLYDIIKNASADVFKSLIKEKNIESISYATVTAVNTDGTYNVMIADGTTEYKNMLNKSVTTPLIVGDCVILRYVQGNVGNGYISEKMGVDRRGGGASGGVTSVDGLTGDVILNDVKYTAQTLTTDQQTQARTNIGAVNDKNYVYTQSTASASWVIAHNLNKYPSVSIVDSGGNMVMGEITYTDVNNLTITFSASFSGKAYLN